MPKRLFAIALITLSLAGYAQDGPKDVADEALLSAFQRDYGIVLCPYGKSGSLRDLRDVLEPHIAGFDPKDRNLYATFVKAVYTAFPCPFTPLRPELRPATKRDVTGVWLVPNASGRLRHGPKSTAWTKPAGLPPIKCEGIVLHVSGVYRVAQLRADPKGDLPCPQLEQLKELEGTPSESSWQLVAGNRIRVTRTDIPGHFEEWEAFAVATSFTFSGIAFNVGDVVAYLRGEQGNEINASTTFRHLQRLQ
jgi:hypothetical protein